MLSNDTWAMILCMILLALAGGIGHLVLLVLRVNGKVDALGVIEADVKMQGRQLAVHGTLLDEHGRRLDGHGEKLAQVQMLIRRGKGGEEAH